MPDMASWLGARSPRILAVIAFILGAVAALGQAPWSLWPLSILAFGGLFGCFTAARTVRRAAWTGLAGGAGYFAVALSWIVEPFLVDVARHGWMAPFALVLISVGFALFWAGAQAIARALGGGAWVWTSVLTLSEALRGWLWTGFPWAQPGHVWISTPMLRWSAYGGALPLTFLLLITGAAIWHCAQGRWRSGAIGLGVTIALLIGGGMMPGAPRPTADAPVVRLVQPNVPQDEKWDPDRMGFYFDRQMAFTAAGAVPDLIVWPETALPVLLNRADGVIAQIAQTARGAPVVLGVQRAEDARYYNSLLLLDGQGRQAALYDKHHLVPFGEYMPLGNFMARFGIRGLAQQSGYGYSAGPGPQLIDMGALGSALPLICYEGVFARDVAGAPGRADFLLLITNDAWFGKLSGPYQHLAQARLRSVEQGLPMIRAANTGVSAMIDAAGQIIAQIPLGEAGYLDTPLPPTGAPTLYSRTGDLPSLLLLFLFAAAPAGLHRRRIARAARG
ncbi:apolipoprotein N-acyltransferase [Roseovarius sp. Pro17]|uniref:apolipoprotein N-acyltransferase n=1 Tax=Roseovarius sp. Pro17 TaxID=3108175 RepID=UPI002D79B28F|nr:apolipoprotein N-acyltransferase [Roseovarius sp. Pro17]